MSLDRHDPSSVYIKQNVAGNEQKDRGKQFEGSLTRVVILMTITYCTLLGYMIFLGVERPGESRENIKYLIKDGSEI